MNRFKFNMYDKKEKAYIRNIHNAFELNDCFKNDDFIVLQHTNKTDKNGKTIVEGDIIYKKGSKNWKNEKLLSKVIWSSDSAAFMISDENGLHQMPMNSNNIEILGNIYENKELLESEG